MTSDDEPTFTERLWPGGLVWGTTVFFALAVGIAVFPASPPVAIGAAAVVLATGVALAWLTTPLVAVADGELRAGRARIPVSLLGEPVALDAVATRAALGPDLDARAFVCLRAWAGTAVQVPVNDPRDPTPYWFVSSRRPELLAAAIRAAQATTAPGTTTAGPPPEG